MDKMREEFEAWVKLRGGYTMKRDKEYESSMTREWWQAWQASRQALVVGLNSNRKFFSKDEIFQKLSDAGIKCT